MQHALLHQIHMTRRCDMSGCDDCLKAASKERHRCCVAGQCSSGMSIAILHVSRNMMSNFMSPRLGL